MFQGVGMVRWLNLGDGWERKSPTGAKEKFDRLEDGWNLEKNKSDDRGYEGEAVGARGARGGQGGKGGKFRGAEQAKPT